MNQRSFNDLRQFAEAVGLKLRREFEDQDGTPCYVLHNDRYDLVTEYDAPEVADSIAAYAGSHQGFAEAAAAYNGAQPAQNPLPDKEVRS